jgi:hypothetical protein
MKFLNVMSSTYHNSVNAHSLQHERNVSSCYGLTLREPPAILATVSCTVCVAAAQMHTKTHSNVNISTLQD